MRNEENRKSARWGHGDNVRVRGRVGFFSTLGQYPC